MELIGMFLLGILTGTGIVARIALAAFKKQEGSKENE